jgi:hypothetical protein
VVGAPADALEGVRGIVEALAPDGVVVGTDRPDDGGVGAARRLGGWAANPPNTRRGTATASNAASTASVAARGHRRTGSGRSLRTREATSIAGRGSRAMGIGDPRLDLGTSPWATIPSRTSLVHAVVGEFT